MATKLLCFNILVLSLFLTVHFSAASRKQDAFGEKFELVSEYDDFKEQLPKAEKEIYTCLSNLTADCTMETFSTIFYKGRITLGCCKKSLAMGQTCYHKLVDHELNKKELRSNHTRYEAVHHKSHVLWDNCAAALDDSHIVDVQ